jgi:hypothetical protein
MTAMALAPGGQIGALVAAHLHRVDPSFHHPSIEAFCRKRRSFFRMSYAVRDSNHHQIAGSGSV